MTKELTRLFRSNVSNDSWATARMHRLRCVRVVVFDQARNALEIINRMRHIEVHLPKGAELSVPHPFQFQWQWSEFASPVNNDKLGAIEAVHSCLCQHYPSFKPWGAMVWINTAPEHGTRWMVAWRDVWHPKYDGPYEAWDISPGLELPPQSGHVVVLGGT